MAKGRGRPNKYETNVKPYLEDIKRWCLDKNEKQIAEILGVGYSSWCDYKNKYPELSDSLKKGREALVTELKSVLIRKAKGFSYTEKKIIRENGIVTREEEYQRSSLPDIGAIHLLLKNLDPEWTNDDKTTIEIKKQQLEIAKQKADNDAW